MDLFLLVSLVASFATLVTAHAALGFGLLGRDPWWRGAVALVIPPLAPYWGFREKMRARSLVWAAAALVYAGARVLSATTTR